MTSPMGSDDLHGHAEKQMKRGSALTTIAELIQKSEDAKCHEGGQPFLDISEYDGLACAIEIIAFDMLAESEYWYEMAKKHG